MKPAKNVLILGGYGRKGMEIARQLLEHSPHSIGLAGRDHVKAARSARELDWKHPGRRVRAVQVNAALKKQLTRALSGYDLVVVALSSTTSGREIAQAALEAGVDCVDVSANERVGSALAALDRQVQDAGLTFIKRADLVHGVPRLMERYLDRYFDSVHKITSDGPSPSRGSRFLAALCPLFRAPRGPESRRGEGLRNKLRSHNQEHSRTSAAAGSARVTVKGVKGGVSGQLSLTLEHRDPGLADAIAVLPVILGVLDGTRRKPGVRPVEQALDPDRYLESMWDMGMTVSLEGLSDFTRDVGQANEMELLEQVA